MDKSPSAFGEVTDACVLIKQRETEKNRRKIRDKEISRIRHSSGQKEERTCRQDNSERTRGRKPTESEQTAREREATTSRPEESKEPNTIARIAEDRPASTPVVSSHGRFMFGEQMMREKRCTTCASS